jgi:hypothetical protein
VTRSIAKAATPQQHPGGALLPFPIQSLRSARNLTPTRAPCSPIPGPAGAHPLCPTPTFALGLHSPLFGIGSPGSLGGGASPGGLSCALGGAKWHQDIDPEVWFEDNEEQLGTMQEFFSDHASLFKADGAAAAGGSQPAAAGSQAGAGAGGGARGGGAAAPAGVASGW